MRSVVGLAACVLAVVGCGGADKEPAPQPSGTVVPQRSRIAGPAKVEPPNFEARTSLRMIRKGDSLRVGDNMDTALRVFPEEKNAYRVSEMPPGWKDAAYTAQGWDTGTTGFAGIVFDEKIALGLYHEDKANETRLQEILEVYERMNESPAAKVTGSRVRYWFWEDQPQRLMICAIQAPRAADGLNITVALGDYKIMDILAMNPLAADKDRQLAEKLFQEALKSSQNR